MKHLMLFELRARVHWTMAYLKGRLAADEHVEDDAERPDVDGWCVVRVAEEDLGRRVGQRAARSLQLLARVVLVREAKVGQLHLSHKWSNISKKVVKHFADQPSMRRFTYHAQFLEEDDVLGLEVAVHHVQLMAVRNGVHHLQSTKSSTRLILLFHFIVSKNKSYSHVFRMVI